jgi:chromosome partition protein MukB
VKRTRAAALVLVNWRGTFYERYLLDRHVTALEGANGSGKTTVLIGAYVVMLPDMSRLRFTSVGEHGGTGGDRGLWGRLGHPGRPSYSVLDLRLPSGERFLAGVHLERKGEPTVEPTPFLITELSEETALSDVLLVRNGELDEVPELAQLRANVTRAGAHMQTFNSAKEYFAALFDRGVNPLRLATDEDRTKLNEMLRTSMTGGISRALTNELRDFLLKEETGLADTLKRMRLNLEACRRTRVEVEESRRLEAEISSVYEAGQEMFAAAVHATRERADELERRVHVAREVFHDAEREYERLTEQAAESGRELSRLKEQMTELRRALQQDREQRDRLKRAQVVLRQIRQRESDLAEAEKELDKAQRARAEAERHRDSCRRTRDEAFARRDDAAEGLADFQRGLEELNRRATEHRLALAQLEEAARLLPDRNVGADQIAELRSWVDGERESAESQIVAAEQQLSTYETRREEYGAVFEALASIAGQPMHPEEALERARNALARLRQLDAAAKKRGELPRSIAEAENLSQRQVRARDKAARLESPERLVTSQAAVEQTLAQTEAKLSAAEERHRRAEVAAASAARDLAIAREDVRELEIAAGRWRETTARVRSIEVQWVWNLKSREDVVRFRAELTQRRDQARLDLAESTRTRQALHDEATQLEQTGGAFSPELLRARDAVEGELLAGQFEETAVDQAGTMQALLGPLAEAIVVEDPRVASQQLAKIVDRPSSIWLVGGEAAIDLDGSGRPRGEILGGKDVLVSSPGGGWRVTRVPEQPTLGKRARDRRVAALREKAENIARDIDTHRSSIGRIESSLAVSDRILAEADVLEGGNPSVRSEELRARATELEAQETAHREQSKQLKAEIDALRPLQRGFRDLLPDSWLLDAPDQEARLVALRSELEASKQAAATLNAVYTSRKLLEEKLDVLRSPPPTDDAILALQHRLEELEERDERLTRAMLALRYVDEHRPALEWTDAESALKSKSELAPALKEQLERAKVEVKDAEQRANAAEGAVNDAFTGVNAVDARARSQKESLARLREEWSELGVDDAADAVVTGLEETIRTREGGEQALDAKMTSSAARFAQDDLLARQGKDKLDEAKSELDDEERAWNPESERWQRLASAAESHGVLGTCLTQRFVESFSGQGSPNLRGKAREAATVLKERLSHARDSEEVQSAVTGLINPQDLSGEIYLQAWLAVRDWLRRRIPAQIAEVDEPLEALGRLRENLASLEVKLTRQESDLKGESGDVARNIDIHLRRAQRQIVRLNQDLQSVRFGSIQSVKLHLDRVAQMEQVLNALREGDDEGDLFQAEMPIEEALDKLFSRFGGGKTGGQRLLDYREYLDPRVLVKRQASADWEQVNPSRISTGEGIGIGAALMMVVLTAWERDANLLRPKRAHGTLRLLFLDEANRLDKDNLGVLFDLCENLDLQLLLAAPEVARATGNTTYRLVRHVGQDGQEEVIVTGRRVADGREGQASTSGPAS